MCRRARRSPTLSDLSLFHTHLTIVIITQQYYTLDRTSTFLGSTHHITTPPFFPLHPNFFSSVNRFGRERPGLFVPKSIHRSTVSQKVFKAALIGHLAAFSTGVPRGEGFWEHAVLRCLRGIRRGLAASQEEDGCFPSQAYTRPEGSRRSLPGVGLRNRCGMETSHGIFGHA